MPGQRRLVGAGATRAERVVGCAGAGVTGAVTAVGGPAGGDLAVDGVLDVVHEVGGGRRALHGVLGHAHGQDAVDARRQSCGGGAGRRHAVLDVRARLSGGMVGGEGPVGR